MNKDLLEKILNDVSKTSIAVIGDFCMDAYWMMDAATYEFSLETGKPTQRVREQRYTLGGASNVANNLISLEPESVFAIGAIGDDMFGREIKRQLSGLKVNVDGLIQFKQWVTPVFGKPYTGDEEERRVDFGMFNAVTPEIVRELLFKLNEILDRVQAVIINQQLDNSIYSGKLIKEINAIIGKHRDKYFVVDSRQNNGSFRGCYIKLNQSEALCLAGCDDSCPETAGAGKLTECAEKIRVKTGAKAVVITRGQKGMLVYRDNEAEEIHGINLMDKVDTVGAGDTVVSALAAFLAAGAGIVNAAKTANFAAAVTVRKLFQCGTASREEIVNTGRDPDYIYNSELAGDMRRAVYLPETEIEIINQDVETRYITHVIFDHDGTISTLRQGWEKIMEDVMVRIILGDKYGSERAGLYEKVLARVKEFIDKSTGIQTIVQMKHMVKIVKEFGSVPDKEILDEAGYKGIYNEALMKMVNKRINKLRAGQLSAGDFTIKGAYDFIKELYGRGIKLYLASGTDEADVKNEAGILGYDKFFEGGIYGAAGNADKCSKKIIIDRILEENNLSGRQLACFGDGPVELRETHKRGGITAGIASDELKRFGLNTEKRTRLIHAGADIVVPDYSQAGALLKFLFGKNGGVR
ncbi:MAG: HAD hydrolase-like protein [Candidatus Omnitrophica bacterium]|nr:HAD hydrolase-like protein [Candidatus Omnitrophota bacterium]